MTETDVSPFFDEYAAAFSAFDVDRICALWAYPAFMAGRGQRAALDEAAFRANTEALCAFYRAQGVARAAKRVVAFEPLTATIAAVLTEDVLTDGEGAQVAAWRHGYLVSETAAGLKAIAALPDAELDAWERRGTKLGAW